MAMVDPVHESQFTLHTYPLLYEINTRCWLNALSETSGRRITLANVPESEFTNWWRLGFTHVWLMGVWTTGPRSRAIAQDAFKEIPNPDVAGSPYSIADYQVPDALGGEIGLQEFRRELQRHGIKLLLDFVPNHLGLDHAWTSQQPELFVQSPNAAPGTFLQETIHGPRWLAHGRDPYFAPWTDTVQLDYRQPATRAAMQAELLDIAGRCDGVRCDMAMLVLRDVFEKTWAAFPPVQFGVPPSGGSHSGPPEGGTPNCGSEFWTEAIAATKRQHPDFLFLAEAYWGLEARLQSLGFNYTYDKELYDHVIRRNPKGVQDRVLKSDPRFVEAGAHFLENHDEPRIASLLSFAEHRAAAWLILALPGLRLLHEGQLTGALIKTPVQLSRRNAETEQPVIKEFYNQLLLLLQGTAVGHGRATLLEPYAAWPGNPTAQDFIVVQWQNSPLELDLVAINLATHPGQCRVGLKVAGLAERNWWITIQGRSDRQTLHGAELQERGLFLDVPEHGAQLIRVKSVA